MVASSGDMVANQAVVDLVMRICLSRIKAMLRQAADVMIPVASHGRCDSHAIAMVVNATGKAMTTAIKDVPMRVMQPNMGK